LTDEIEENEVNIPVYNMIRCNAVNRNTGGVVLFVTEDIMYELVLIKKLKSNYWCAEIEVKEILYKEVIVVVYHSPTALHDEFLRLIEEIVEEFIENEGARGGGREGGESAREREGKRVYLGGLCYRFHRLENFLTTYLLGNK